MLCVCVWCRPKRFPLSLLSCEEPQCMQRRAFFAAKVVPVSSLPIENVEHCPGLGQVVATLTKLCCPQIPWKGKQHQMCVFVSGVDQSGSHCPFCHARNHNVCKGEPSLLRRWCLYHPCLLRMLNIAQVLVKWRRLWPNYVFHKFHERGNSIR